MYACWWFCVGVPSTEQTMSGNRVPSQLLLNWDSERMKQFILDAFPRLEDVEYQFIYADKEKNLHVIPAHINTPRGLKEFRVNMGRSALYIRPAQNISATAQSSSTSHCEPRGNTTRPSIPLVNPGPQRGQCSSNLTEQDVVTTFVQPSTSTSYSSHYRFFVIKIKLCAWLIHITCNCTCSICIH